MQDWPRCRCVPEGPGCGARGRWRGLAGLRDDAPSEARGADGSRAGRRPRAHQAARPNKAHTAPGGYRTQRVGWGLVPGVVVEGGVVEFVEAYCVAPAGDDGGGLVVLRGLLPGVFEVCVGGHGGQDCRCWLRVRRVGVAPPEHGFHASGQAHAAVIAQNLAQLGVRAFDLVGCCGHRLVPGGVQVRGVFNCLCIRLFV